MLSTGEADLIAAASLAFLASACPQDDSYGSEEDDQVCLALPVQRKQGFERACCAERTDYTVIKRHLLEAEECASQRVKSLSWSTAAPSSMHASADRFDANGSDAGNHGSDDTITGAQANGGDVQQGGVGDHDHGVGVAGSNDEPRGSGGSDGTARPPSSDAPDDHGVVKAGDDDGGVYQVVGLGSGDGIVGTGGWHAVENDLSQLRSLRTELLQGLALHVRGTCVCVFAICIWCTLSVVTGASTHISSQPQGSMCHRSSCDCRCCCVPSSFTPSMSSSSGRCSWCRLYDSWANTPMPLCDKLRCNCFRLAAGRSCFPCKHVVVMHFIHSPLCVGLCFGDFYYPSLMMWENETSAAG